LRACVPCVPYEMRALNSSAFCAPAHSSHHLHLSALWETGDAHMRVTYEIEEFLCVQCVAGGAIKARRAVSRVRSYV